MERIRRQKTFLKAITSAANRIARKALIKHANKDQVNAVSEIVMNLLKNNVPVIPVTMARLRPYRQILSDQLLVKYRSSIGQVSVK